jgi:hypothetical protein
VNRRYYAQTDTGADQRRRLDVGRNAEQFFHLCIAELVDRRNARGPTTVPNGFARKVPT